MLTRKFILHQKVNVVSWKNCRWLLYCYKSISGTTLAGSVTLPTLMYESTMIYPYTNTTFTSLNDKNNSNNNMMLAHTKLLSSELNYLEKSILHGCRSILLNSNGITNNKYSNNNKINSSTSYHTQLYQLMRDLQQDIVDSGAAGSIIKPDGNNSIGSSSPSSTTTTVLYMS